MNSTLRTLRERIRSADARLRSIDHALSHLNSQDYRAQELRGEARDVAAVRRHAQAAIEKMRQPDRVHGPGQDRREALIEMRLKERTQQITKFVEKLERAGEYRQARIWRMELLNLRQRLEEEIPA